MTALLKQIENRIQSGRIPTWDGRPISLKEFETLDAYETIKIKHKGKVLNIHINDIKL